MTTGSTATSGRAGRYGERVPHDLAGGGAGDRADQQDLVRCGGSGQLAPARREERRAVDVVVGRYHVADRHLAQPVVGPAGDGAVGDAGQRA